MEKSEVLGLVLGNKMQIDKESLEYISEKRFAETFLKETLASLKMGGKYEITIKDVKNMENNASPTDDMIVLKKHEPAPERMSIEDIIQDRIITYETIRKLLQYRWELTNVTSINKARSTEKFSLIAEVVALDRAGKTAILQDNTGTKTVSISGLDEAQITQLGIGDIVGAVCENNNGTYVTKVVSPDISLFKTRKTPDKKVLIALVYGMESSKKGKQASDIIERYSKEHDIIYVVDFEDDPQHKQPNHAQNNIKSVTVHGKETGGMGISKAALLSICGVNLLVCHKNILRETDKQLETMTGMLKRRIVDCQKIGDMSVSPLVIDPVPDIFITNMGGNQQANYKNTMMFSIDSLDNGNMFWLVDLQTYECLKIPLA